MNCWEYMKCGREKGGVNAEDGNVCPASTAEFADGINDGLNGGRCCWAISGSLCQVINRFDTSHKSVSCLTCDFFKKVEEEEGVAKFSIFKDLVIRQRVG